MGDDAHIPYAVYVAYFFHRINSMLALKGKRRPIWPARVIDSRPSIKIFTALISGMFKINELTIENMVICSD
jgi:hypothetical protein